MVLEIISPTSHIACSIGAQFVTNFAINFNVKVNPLCFCRSCEKNISLATYARIQLIFGIQQSHPMYLSSTTNIIQAGKDRCSLWNAWFNTFSQIKIQQFWFVSRKLENYKILVTQNRPLKKVKSNFWGTNPS